MNRPQPFGRYELLDRISAGGMAEVFRARDARRGGQVVALKKILPHIAEDEEFIQMFEDEARIASQLEHPHIARTLDFGTIDQSYYIAFEYVNGKDMRAIYERAVRLKERIPLSFLLYVFARIGEGLSYAHARRDASGAPVSIVHRDVSPQNIVVSFDGDVKLIDFGIAKAAGKLSRTAVGTIKGKFGYMSPEQVRGMEVDQRTDIFSLGISMWELLTLQRLFAAENEILVLEKIRNLKIPPPSSLDASVPPELDRIVLKALSKDLDGRYRSAKELYRDLNALAESASAVAAREEVAAYMRRAFAEAADKTGLDPGSHSGPRPTPQVPRGQPQAPGSVQASRASGAGMSYNAGAPPRGQETPMAADNKGSDLDIFEGLGKKSPSAGPPAPSRVPPPPGSRGAPPPPPTSGDLGKKTLLGIAAPQTGIGHPPVVPPPRSGPPGAGRGSLPAVAPPPSKSAPPPASTRPAPYAAAPSGGMDMDWDDDDEATHIFDKDSEGSHAGPAPAPAAGRPAAGARAVPPPPATAPLLNKSAPPPPPPGNNMGFQRTMAMNAPPPPPPGAMPPPPPASSVGSAFARASSAPAGAMAPPPPTIDPRPLINPHGMTMPLGQAPPVGNLAGQVHTEPLQMPPRPPSAAPPPPPGAAFQMTQPAQGMPQQGMQQQMQQPQMQQGMQQPQMQQMMQQAPRTMEATALVRPPSSSKAGLIIGLFVAVLVIAGAVGGYMFLMPHTGNIAINVADSKGGAVSSLEVTVDGKTVCDHAPCSVTKVKTGSHEVKVTAKGYDTPAPKLIAVESGKTAQIDFALSGGAAAGTGFKVTGTQPGVKLLVDGSDVGSLPQELHDLKPGDHQLKFVGKPEVDAKTHKEVQRYEPLEKTVTVKEGEVTDLDSVTLKVLIGKATITLGTPGAKVTLVSSTGDRRNVTTFPISVDIDTSKATWTIEASKFGYEEAKLPISFDDGQAEKVFNVELQAKGAAPTYHPTTTHTTHTTTTHTTTTHVTPSGGAKLAVINALPMGGTVVVLDGKPLGAVPKKNVSVSAGSHTLIFINPGKSLKKVVHVSVGAGENKNVIVHLD